MDTLSANINRIKSTKKQANVLNFESSAVRIYVVECSVDGKSPPITLTTA